MPSTVSREVAANGGRDDYRAWASYLKAAQRCRRPKPTKLASRPELLSEVTAGLKGFVVAPGDFWLFALNWGV